MAATAFSMAMKRSGISGEMPSTKSIDAAVARNICRFLRAWLLKYFPDPTTATGFRGTAAAEKLGLSQGYLSELGRLRPTKKPGLNVVLRLREQSGASFEEITGHRPALSPPRPFSRLTHDSSIAASAADEAESLPDDGPSSTFRAAPSVGRPPKK